MGTPEFAVPSLQALVEKGFQVEAVVTAPDRPAGRGLKIHAPAVKSAALSMRLPVLQPDKLDDAGFIRILTDIQPALIMVVAFRKLPEQIWQIPRWGTVNLHASLLPQFRGAAPINWAIMHGETKTGLTTFYINDRIDTGDIISAAETSIGSNETAGQLHDRLKLIGADLVCQTASMIFDGKVHAQPQDLSMLDPSQLKKAPKITDTTCRIDWQKDLHEIYNRVRGLSPYPTAYTMLLAPDGQTFRMKVFFARPICQEHTEKPGQVISDGRCLLRITSPGGYLDLIDIQLDSRKRMDIATFLPGFHIDGTWRAL